MVHRPSKQKIERFWGDVKMKCPCGTCENQGCGSFHEHCEKYLEFKSQRQKVYKERYEASKMIKLKDEMKKRRCSLRIDNNSPLKHRKG